MNQDRKNFRVTVIIEKDEDGYTGFCPELQGCYSQGETYEELLDNIRDAIRLHISDRLESGEKIPRAQVISLTTVDVPV
jgi:predicted RNase H-like HicB family nuclease